MFPSSNCNAVIEFVKDVSNTANVDGILNYWQPGMDFTFEIPPNTGIDLLGTTRSRIATPVLIGGIESNPWDKIPLGILRTAQRFGSSGRNWETKRSYWVGFDCDHASNHPDGLCSLEIKELKHYAYSLPYVEIRRSTSGRGLHLRVFTDHSTPTQNDHRLLSQEILSTMEKDTGFKFTKYLDTIALNFWLWGANVPRKAFRLIKPALQGF